MDYNISQISFPGLGIGPFDVSSTAFTLFGRDIKWYGVIICFGIIVAFTYFALMAKRNGIVFDTVIDFTIVTVPLGVIGARLFFCVFYGVPFKDIYKIWEGGLAIYGAIIFGALGVILMCKIKKVNFFKFADLIGPGVQLAQAIGRWGNFMNGEAYGSETTAFSRMGLISSRTGFKYVEVHPAFLYESLWNLIGFALINIFGKKKKFDGELLLWYVGWYGFGRTFIEMLRVDSLYIGSIRVSSLIGAICFIICLPLDIILRVRYKKLKEAGKIEEGFMPDILFLLGITKKKAEVKAETAEIKDTAEPAEESTETVQTEETTEEINAESETINNNAEETENGSDN